MESSHSTDHGTRRKEDSLDLLEIEAKLLAELFSKWYETTPEGKDRQSAVTAKWDHGTVGKLLLEHSAVWLAAEADVLRVIERVDDSRMATILRRLHDLVRPIVDSLAESSFGMPPIELAVTSNFVSAVEELHRVLAPELLDRQRIEFTVKVGEQLGSSRRDLRSAKFILKHAPAHPGLRHWYDRIPLLVRVHSVFDRLQGFPWGESSIGDRNLALKFDRSLRE